MLPIAGRDLHHQRRVKRCPRNPLFANPAPKIAPYICTLCPLLDPMACPKVRGLFQHPNKANPHAHVDFRGY